MAKRAWALRYEDNRSWMILKYERPVLVLRWCSALYKLSTLTQSSTTKHAWLDWHSWPLSLVWWRGELKKNSLRVSAASAGYKSTQRLKNTCSVCLVRIASGSSRTVDLRPGVACKPRQNVICWLGKNGFILQRSLVSLSVKPTGTFYTITSNLDMRTSGGEKRVQNEQN